MTNQPTTDFSTHQPIMAVDFDGTLVENEYPDIGRERVNFCKTIRILQKMGVRSILWTSRTGDALRQAIEWCEDHDLHFDTVNENLPEIIEMAGGIDTRKVFADVYFDDRNRTVDATFMKKKVEEVWSWLGK